MKKVVVTGCSGFIGSWICEKVLNAGYQVIGLDNLGSGVDYTSKNIEFYNVDLNSNIKDILSGADAIVHSAAYAELRHNWENPAERQKLFLNNEVATRNILEQMPNVPLVFLSTAAVYGSLSNNKINSRPLLEEDANPEFVESPYAASKLACESYIAAWSHKRKTPWYSLRLVNQIGARTHRGVIVDFLRMIREKNHIHAADNGNQKKNWVNVEDTANVVVKLLNDHQQVPSGIYTVTSSERWSWRDIVDVMLKMHEEKYPNSEKPFTLSYEDRLGGSVGDPLNLHVSGEKLKPYYSCDLSVEKAVRDALAYLGWAQ
jgi:nucleoside-diphosphate-sugar epimerase